MSFLEIAALVVLGLMYGGSGLAELPRWRKLVDQFTRWHYPPWMAWLTPAIKVTAMALAIAPKTRPLGVGLCVCVGVAGAGTVLHFRDRAWYKAALPAALVTLACAYVLLA